MRTYRRVVGLIAGLFLLGCGAVAPPPNPLVAHAHVFPALYIGPLANDQFVTGATIQAFRLAVVHSEEAAAQHVARHPEIAVIYVHPQKLAEIDADWLGRQYTRGVTIVAIHTPLNDLARRIGTEVSREPHRSTINPQRSGILMSMQYFVHDVETQRITGRGFYTDYHASFETFPDLVNHLLFSNGKR